MLKQFWWLGFRLGSKLGSRLGSRLGLSGLHCVKSQVCPLCLLGGGMVLAQEAQNLILDCIVSNFVCEVKAKRV